jgi:hypothetical protein
VQPFPEKLNIPTPSDPGQPFPHVPYEQANYDSSNLFDRFIPSELFPEIANNTNQFARQERAKETKSRGKEGRKRRPWKDITAMESGGYIGQDDNLPNWPVGEYISLKRFQQISRYLKINKPGDLPSEQWYKKVEPLASSFREATSVVGIANDI